MEKRFENKTTEEIREMIRRREEELYRLQYTDKNRLHSKNEMGAFGNICRLHAELERRLRSE